MNYPNTKPRWLSSIQTIEEANEVIADSAMGFYLVASIQFGMGMLLSEDIVWDGVAFGVLGAALHRWKKRSIAVALLTLSLLVTTNTLLSVLGYTQGGGKNFILAAIILWAAGRAMYATDKLVKLNAAAATA